MVHESVNTCPTIEYIFFTVRGTLLWASETAQFPIPCDSGPLVDSLPSFVIDIFTNFGGKSKPFLWFSSDSLCTRLLILTVLNWSEDDRSLTWSRSFIDRSGAGILLCNMCLEDWRTGMEVPKLYLKPWHSTKQKKLVKDTKHVDSKDVNKIERID